MAPGRKILKVRAQPSLSLGMTAVTASTHCCEEGGVVGFPAPCCGQSVVFRHCGAAVSPFALDVGAQQPDLILLFAQREAPQEAVGLLHRVGIDAASQVRLDEAQPRILQEGARREATTILLEGVGGAPEVVRRSQLLEAQLVERDARPRIVRGRTLIRPTTGSVFELRV